MVSLALFWHMQKIPDRSESPGAMLSVRCFELLHLLLSTIVTPGLVFLAFWVCLVLVQLLAQQVLLGFSGATNNSQQAST